MLLLPCIPFAITFGAFGASWVWAKLVGKRSVFGVHLFFMCQSSAETRACGLSGLSQSVPFLHIIYNGLCMRAFNTFSCIPLRDGTSVLYVAPDIICWSGNTHAAMVAASAVAIVVYVIGIPCYVLSTMTYARGHDKLSDSEWLQVLGFMYTRYGMPCDACPSPIDAHNAADCLQNPHTTCGSSRSFCAAFRSAFAWSSFASTPLPKRYVSVHRARTPSLD